MRLDEFYRYISIPSEQRRTPRANIGDVVRTGTRGVQVVFGALVLLFLACSCTDAGPSARSRFCDQLRHLSTELPGRLQTIQSELERVTPGPDERRTAGNACGSVAAEVSRLEGRVQELEALGNTSMRSDKLSELRVEWVDCGEVTAADLQTKTRLIEDVLQQLTAQVDASQGACVAEE